MSKRILAIALFAVMVLSLVPVSQATARWNNNVYFIEMKNQVQSGTQQAGIRALDNATGYPGSNTVSYPAYASGSTTGDRSISANSVSNSWNNLSLTSAFADLYKRTQTYSTSDIARYDIWVKLAIVDTNVLATSTNRMLFSFPNTSITDTISVPTVTDNKIYSLGFLTNYSSNAAILSAKKYLNFEEITMNGSVLKTEYLAESHLAYETTGDGIYNLFYYLKVAEFDVTDVASKTMDITLLHKTVHGENHTYIRPSFTNSGESDKPIKPLYLKPNRKGDDGLYNIYVVNGVIFIDYAHDIANSNYYWANSTDIDGYAAIPVGFKFYEDAAATVRVPASGKYAYATVGDSDTPASNRNNKFFVQLSLDAQGAIATRIGSENIQNNLGAASIPAFSPYAIRYNDMKTYVNKGALNDDRPIRVEGRQIKNDADFIMGVWLPNKYNKEEANSGTITASENKTMKVGIYDDNYRYRTGDIKVVFRPLPRNLISTAVIVERYLTIAVGETVELTIESASATTYNNLKLAELNSVKSHVYIDGMKLTGLSVGTSEVQVSASGRVIDQITVNVVATKDTITPAPVANSWRVLARKLNIRSGPGTSYGKVGTLVMNQVVAGEDTGTGWVQIGNGQYVSKQYVVPVTGSILGVGTYVVTASSLNVRSGPGSSYAKTGSVPGGSTVSVAAVQNGWAQLTSGGWVSTLYLR